MSSKFLSYVHLVNFKQFRCIFLANCQYESHYDVLNLKKNCSQAEIRSSYLKLSKEYHPDKNKKDTHKEFVKISEAYNVLSKPFSRYDYDLRLHNSNPGVSVYRGTRDPESGVWTDHTFWEHRNKNRDSYYESKPYYGIKGVQKLPNFIIVLICVGFTSIGVILQYFAIRKSFTLRRDEMEKRSAELETLHSQIRAQAVQNGDKKQLDIIKERLKYKNM